MAEKITLESLARRVERLERLLQQQNAVEQKNNHPLQCQTLPLVGLRVEGKLLPLSAVKFGRDRDGIQRYQCQSCRKTFADRPTRPLGAMRIPLEKALIVLHHLVEGVSVRGPGCA